MNRRQELESWIARTRHNERTLGLLVAGATAIAIGLMAWKSSVGLVALGIVAIVAVCGFWVLVAHVADWRGKLARMDEQARRTRDRAQ
jgi:uncharacterized membrane protein YphA (DoxX/SURF4 family)